MMNAEELRELLSSIKHTDIEELHMESNGNKIFFRKTDVVPVAVMAKPDMKAAAAPEKITLPFKSPMVGTFFHSESSDHPPFVIEGNHIVPGQKIGIIEAMKIIKDVTSNVKGKIVKVCVKNGQSVEYGQELFIIDPEIEAAAANGK